MTEHDEAFERISRFSEEWAKIGTNLQKAMQPQTEAFQKMQATIQAFARSPEIVKAAEAMQRVQLAAQVQIEELSPKLEIFDKYFKSIQEQIAPALEGIQKAFEDLPPRTQKALRKLAEHGWFLDLELPVPALWEIEKALSEGSLGDAEAELVDYYESRLDTIETSIVAAFPLRARFIQTAFRLHRNGDYAASIPLLLAQTDGICRDVTDHHFFIKHDGKPATAIFVERLAADSYVAALLSPLALALPIAASERQRDADFSGLNRHTVLHGESLDYDTKVNAVRTISLIQYVAAVLKFEHDA